MKMKGLGEDALGMLSHIYYEILKVNLTEDTYEKIKTSEEEISVESREGAAISAWLQEFVEQNQIHPDDRRKYVWFTDLTHLKAVFHGQKTYICCHFRRKTKGEFRWVSMELVPAKEYSHEKPGSPSLH